MSDDLERAANFAKNYGMGLQKFKETHSPTGRSIASQPEEQRVVVIDGVTHRKTASYLASLVEGMVAVDFGATEARLLAQAIQLDHTLHPHQVEMLQALELLGKPLVIPPMMGKSSFANQYAEASRAAERREARRHRVKKTHRLKGLRP